MLLARQILPSLMQPLHLLSPVLVSKLLAFSQNYMRGYHKMEMKFIISQDMIANIYFLHKADFVAQATVARTGIAQRTVSICDPPQHLVATYLCVWWYGRVP